MGSHLLKFAKSGQAIFIKSDSFHFLINLWR